MTSASSGEALRVALYLRVSTARQAEHDVSIPDQHKQGEVRLRLKRLLKAIEMGALSLDEPALQERLAYLRALQTRTAEEIRSLQAQLNHTGTLAISPAMLRGIIKAAEQRLLERGHGFRRSYVSVFANRIIAEAGKVQIVRARQ